MCLKPYTYTFKFQYNEDITVNARMKYFAKQKALKLYPLTGDRTDITADLLSWRELKALQTIMFNADLIRVIKRPYSYDR